MGVDPRGDVCVGMPEARRYGGKGNPLRQEAARVSVSQRVERGIFDTGLLHAPADRLRHEVGREIGAVRPTEDQVMFLVHGAHQPAVLAHLSLQELECNDRRLSDAESARLAALRCLDAKAAGASLRGTC